MSSDGEESETREVWCTCDRIRSEISEKDVNLLEIFQALDPDKTGLISEEDFIATLIGPITDRVCLSQAELCLLVNYFRKPDGKIDYLRFCGVTGNDEVTWEDKYNYLSQAELDRTMLVLGAIAARVKKRKLSLRPFFEDYDKTGHCDGIVSFEHFQRVLYFLGLTMGPEELLLLIKRFAQNNYFIDYVAFLEEIDETIAFIEEHKQILLDENENLDKFPGRIITEKMPRLRRPDVGKTYPGTVFDCQTIFHPIMEPKRPNMELSEILHRIQEYVHKNRILVKEFFKGFDYLGKVTALQFRRILDSLRISSIGHLYLTAKEMDLLVDKYKDPNDPKIVLWKAFDNDVNEVYCSDELEHFPFTRVTMPPPEVQNLLRIGQKEWKSVKPELKEICNEILNKIRSKVDGRRMLIKEFFRDYDKPIKHHVSRNQLRRALKTAGFYLTAKEYIALEQKYNDEHGFNFAPFLEDLKPKPEPEPEPELEPAESAEFPICDADETDIEAILMKLQIKLVQERIPINQYFEVYDKHRQRVIKEDEFRRGLALCRCNLSPSEIDIIIDEFSVPNRPNRVDYPRFIESVEQALVHRDLIKTPLFVPHQLIPSKTTCKSILNTPEMDCLNHIMDEICCLTNHNLEELFEDHDKHKAGFIGANQLSRVFGTRNLTHLITDFELGILFKAFSITRGASEPRFDYRHFLKVLEMVEFNKTRVSF